MTTQPAQGHKGNGGWREVGKGGRLKRVEFVPTALNRRRSKKNQEALTKRRELAEYHATMHQRGTSEQKNFKFQIEAGRIGQTFSKLGVSGKKKDGVCISIQTYFETLEDELRTLKEKIIKGRGIGERITCLDIDHLFKEGGKADLERQELYSLIKLLPNLKELRFEKIGNGKLSLLGLKGVTDIYLGDMWPNAHVVLERKQEDLKHLYIRDEADLGRIEGLREDVTVLVEKLAVMCCYDTVACPYYYESISRT